MPLHEPHLHLVCYDIADPARLARVHRHLEKRATPVQYSVFVLYADSIEVDRLAAELEVLIHPRQDDVRIYPLPRHLEVEVLGRGSIPDGIWLSSSTDMLTPSRILSAANWVQLRLWNEERLDYRQGS